MKHLEYDAIVIGGGAAGMAAAVSISRNGHSVAIIEREDCLGGILMQCIHSGFGVHEFKEELTGPEYAERYMEMVEASDIVVLTRTTVVDIVNSNNSKTVTAYSSVHGVLEIGTRAIVLAMGCRERNRGNIGIPGTRPAGIFTAGFAQRLINIDGYVPGKKAVIVGSGDIGLIMARRLVWIGADVKGVVEILPYPSGLTRNISQCLNDFNIPLYLGHIVSRIRGKDRVTGVDVTPLDQGKPVYAKTFQLDCDTILLSVGLIPENELSKKSGVILNDDTGGAFVDANFMTSVEGVFSCGNVLHVHDLVDMATEEAQRCAGYVSLFLSGKLDRYGQRRVVPGANTMYVIPNQCAQDRENRFYLRTFIVKNNAVLIVKAGNRVIREKNLLHVQPSEMVTLTLHRNEITHDIPVDEPLEISVQ